MGSEVDPIPVDALLLFHSQERLLFWRLVELGKEPMSAMGIIALWMWMESVGHPSITGDLVTIPSNKLMRIVEEGEPCLSAILIDPSNPAALEARGRIPTATAVPGSPIDLAYLRTFWPSARKGISSILKDTCPWVFGDLLNRALRERAEGILGGSSSRSVRTYDVTDERALIRMGEMGYYTGEQSVNNSILGPYGDSCAPHGSTNEFWNPSIMVPNVEGVGLAFLPPGKDASSSPLRSPRSIVPYGEGCSCRVPSRSHHFEPRMEGSTTTAGGYRGLHVAEGWEVLSRNILNMQHQTQKNNYLRTMLGGQSLRVPFRSPKADNMGASGRLPVPAAGSMSPQGASSNALVLRNKNNSMAISASRSSSSIALIHERMSKLNIKADIFNPEGYIPPDERTLFITFSNGYPLGARDLFDFFDRRYGAVEDIYIQDVEADEVPLYARAVFYLQNVCLRVLAGNEKAKFMIKGRHVWARRYIPKRKRKGAFKEMRWIRPMRPLG